MENKEKPTMVVVPIEDWEEYQELKKNRETKEFKLEVGGDYIAKNNEEEIVIDRKGRYGNVGFFGGKFVNNIECYKPFIWLEATEEEVRGSFDKECARRHGEGWREVRIKKHANGGTISLNTGGHQISIRKDKHSGWVVWNRNGLIYHKGKWAEKLEEPKFAERLEDIDRPWYIEGDGNIDNLGAYLQDINHLPTQGLAQGVLALIKLLSYRDDVWEKEGKPKDGEGWYGIILTVSEGEPIVQLLGEIKTEFRFKKEETAKWFLKTHRELLTEYQDKLIN